MKTSDYIAKFLVDKGVKTVFLITGGAIAHVVDSIGQRKSEQGDIDFVVVQHEQGGAMAAEAYSRLAATGTGVMVRFIFTDILFIYYVIIIIYVSLPLVVQEQQIL